MSVGDELEVCEKKKSKNIVTYIKGKLGVTEKYEHHHRHDH